MQRVTGVGGVFLRARDAEVLRAWYATHLGIDVREWGGHTFRWHAGGTTTWTVLEKDADYVDPDQPYMMNFRVDDLDAMLAQLRSAGVRVAEEVEDGEFGRFGWAYDVEDNRFELWQPPRGR